jgi:methylmalonyl-CoA mutase
MGNLKEEKLFNEFPPVPVEKWEELIVQDLKGADYEKKLVWKTNEGIKVKPYYTSNDLKNLSHLNANPGEFPFVRGNKNDGNTWEIRQDIKVADLESANKEALEALERGATSVCFITCDKVKTADDLSKLLKDIHFGCIVFNIQACENAPKLFDLLVEEAKKRGYDLPLMEGAINFNPLGILTTSGNWAESETADFNNAKSLIEKAKSILPKYRVLAANGCLFQESGATAVQEAGYTLAIANEYLCRLTDAGLSVDDVAPRIQFNFAVSSNYFMEIAKIRAFRLMWAKVVEAYNPKDKNSAKAYIHSSTAKWNMTAFDPYVNMLRATTESMSAVLGGADSISVKPFDTPFKKADTFSNRIARNTQIVLKEEAYTDRVADPAAGSYYIESLTNSIVEEAWKLFLKIEAEGGYSAALIKGTIQADIEAIAKKRVTDIASRRDTVLGTNQYPNFSEQVLKNIDQAVYTEKQKISAKPIAKPLIKFRGAEQIEALRLATEKSGKRPKVFMLTIGNLAMRLTRSQFSSNFFAIAGFEVIDNNGFKTVEEGVKAAYEAKSDIVVLCSSDEEYAALAPETFEKLSSKAILVVAGAPACQAELEAKGIKNFISMRSNVLDTLRQYQSLLNIL